METTAGGWFELDGGFASYTELEQAAAIRYLKSIANGQAAYAVVCGKWFYAPNLAALARPPPGETTPYLSENLKPASGDTFVERDHYRIEITSPPSAKAPASCNGVQAGLSGDTWQAIATRLKGHPGVSYLVNSDGEVSELR
jgi:hypothetical protein